MVNELSNTVSVWTLDYHPASDRDGCLSLAKTQVIPTFAPGTTAPELSRAAKVHVRDNHVYTSNRNDQLFGSQQDSIAHYAIDPPTGSFTWGESAKAHAWCPTTFDVNRAGTLVRSASRRRATSSSSRATRRRAGWGGRGGGGDGVVAASPKMGYGGSTNGMDGRSHVLWVE